MEPHPQLRQPPSHTSNNSSSTSSVITVQRAASIGPGRSRSRPRAPVPTLDVSNAAGQSYPSSSSQPLTTSPESRRAHSRSNSTSGGVREGIGNLNRWSQSTTSSKGSHQRSGSFSRRMSITGGGSTLTFGNSGSSSLPTQSSPNKLIKRQAPPGSSSLPPLVTAPTHQQSASDNGSSPLTGNITPSTAGILSAALKSTIPDYFGASWEDSQPRDFSVKRSPARSKGDALPVSATTSSAPNWLPRHHTDGEESTPSRGHSRNRSQTGKGSAGTGSSRERNSKQPSQKAMLSKALQKANTAVLLDNAQNFEGAMQAYSEACALLQQVMVRSSGDDDKRKLEAIRTTYTSRISELQKIAPHLQDEGKALPARPESGNYRTDDLQSTVGDDEDEPAIIETATVTRIVNDESFAGGLSRPMGSNSAAPRRRESLLPSALNSGPFRTNNAPDQFIPRSYSRSPMRDRITENSINLAPPMESQYMPPPLSPGRRPQEPMNFQPSRQQPPVELSSSNLSTASPARGHTRAPSNESMSWLDTIDESGGSTTSSIHSRSSSMGLRRKHIRAASGATEAEFDAALDAAVEAAYDDGFEPAGGTERNAYYDDDDEVVANVRRKVELAKERVRQTEREAAIQDARERERKRILQQEQTQQQNRIDDDYDGNESEEEERMLEEMTRGYVMDDFEFGLQSKSALPRESDSSGFSGRTWNSSIGSNPTTAGTTLSTVTEASTVPQVPPLRSKTPPPVHPPPEQALPPPPGPGQLPGFQGVRSRRLSGQNPKQLKIETTVRSPEQMTPVAPAPSMPPPRVPNGTIGVQPKTAGFAAARQALPITNRPLMPQSARQASSPFPGPSPSEIVSPPTPTLTQTFTNDSDNGPLPRSGSPNRTNSRAGIKKNFSSSSLKNLKSRNLSVSIIDDGSDVSPNTPSSQFASVRDGAGRLPAMPTLPTPIAVAFKEKMNGAPNGGLYLFNQDIHSPDSPGSPNPLNAGAPIPLEPCPNEFLLRPFWLMRALYQTIAHPRGGYLSTKLFVPRDVWRVKGVKIRGVEDKIANCDFLTAALMKLAQVDSFDADAVLEEMQTLEGVLEQVQATLSKKLGNEVGVQGSGGLFKDASTGADTETGTIGSSKSGGMSGKSSFSWRRLRPKNSGVGLSSSYSNKAVSADTPKEGLTMSTLPMTSLTTIRFAKRDVSQVQFSGPHANYMSALAKLFDAAQVIDQIARQVEDPGLRHADKTQVGLELCTRHAAEFFGFYVCRFVLTDIGMLLDKFIKRGSEWVLV